MVHFYILILNTKGIPRDLPIQSIKDFKPPKLKKDVMAEDDGDKGLEGEVEKAVEGEVEKAVEGDADQEGETAREGELEGKDRYKCDGIAWDDEFESDVDEDDMFQDDEGVNLEDDLIDIKDIEFLDEDLGEIREEVGV